MLIQLRMLLSSLVVVATCTGLASSVMAQTELSDSEPIRPATVSETFNRAFFNSSGDLYFNRTIPRQINYILGFGSFGSATFPDLELEQDAELINTIYNDVLDQQVSSDPVIRTPDLPNPFNSSLRGLPTARPFGTRVEGSEFIFQTVPPR